MYSIFSREFKAGKCRKNGAVEIRELQRTVNLVKSAVFSSKARWKDSIKTKVSGYSLRVSRTFPAYITYIDTLSGESSNTDGDPLSTGRWVSHTCVHAPGLSSGVNRPEWGNSRRLSRGCSAVWVLNGASGASCCRRSEEASCFRAARAAVISSLRGVQHQIFVVVRLDANFVGWERVLQYNACCCWWCSLCCDS